MDAVASLYGRNNLKEVVEHTAQQVFIPMTVGGGVRSLADAEALLNAGADKVAINTAAIANPQLISDIAKRYGSQCAVVSIEAKKTDVDCWEAYSDNGREKTGRDVLSWAKKLEDYGAGEILLTSIDQEGTRRGFDVELIRQVNDVVSLPIIASGGFGEVQHIIDAVNLGGADAIAIADAFHYQRIGVAELKKTIRAAGIAVRSA